MPLYAQLKSEGQLKRHTKRFVRWVLILVKGKHMTPDKLNAWRIVPRLLILSYMIVFYQTCNWFMALDLPNNAQAGFVSVIVGAGAAWFGLYLNGGVKK